MKLLLDQGTPLSAAELFRRDGCDAVHTSEIDMATAPDDEILRRAKMDGRIVVTLDRDFPQLLALARDESPSVVYVRRQGLTGESFYAAVSPVLRDYQAGLERGGLVSIGRTHARFRRLPLR